MQCKGWCYASCWACNLRICSNRAQHAQANAHAAGGVPGTNHIVDRLIGSHNCLCGFATNYEAYHMWIPNKYIIE